jgi:hypothetical protein
MFPTSHRSSPIDSPLSPHVMQAHQVVQADHVRQVAQANHVLGIFPYSSQDWLGGGDFGFKHANTMI